MAEARSAIGVFEEHKRGVKLLVDDDGIQISFHIPHPKEMRQNLLRTFFRMQRSIVRNVYPAPPLVAVAVIVVVMGMVMAADSSSWLRNGRIAWIAWTIGNWSVPFKSYIPHEFFVAYLAFWCGTIGFFVLMFAQRMILRSLLSYRGFLHLKPRETSKVVYVWAALLKIMSGVKRTALTYSYQDALPRLPLPDLKGTVTRYLESVHPLLSKEEYERTKAMAYEFLVKEGPTLQRYLTFKTWWASNYVTDWWEQYVYLRGRTSIMINSNYYALGPNSYLPTSNQNARAAGLIYQFMAFKQLLDREQVPPLLIRNLVPLCMNQYKRIFSTTRIPHLEEDELKKFSARKSRHVTVLKNGYFFMLPLYTNSSHGKLLTALEIQRQLDTISAEVDKLPPADKWQENLPALTSLDRISWAEAYEKYFSEGRNKEAIEVIESAVFNVVLDDTSLEEWSETGRRLIHGGGNKVWFDKSFNLFVFANGRPGLNTEHAWADAPVIAHVWECVLGTEYLDNMYDEKTGKVTANDASEITSSLPTVKLLQWDLSNKSLQDEISRAVDLAAPACEDLDLEVFQQNEYGKGFIKKQKVSPDAYIQMALQIAYYRDAKHFTQTYEASMTRLYKEGRTETVRPVTDASKAFVLALENKEPKENVIKLMREACETHQANYINAMSGKGVDRHLFTLYCVSVGMGIESPFVKDAISRPWQLSTSQQPQQQTDIFSRVKASGKDRQLDMQKFYSPGGGFGPVVDNGYGVSYMITGEDAVFFHVSSKKGCKETSSANFKKELLGAFRSMKELLDSE